MLKAGVDLNLGIETETLEFKKSTGELKEAMHSICAILNKHQHGELYFGVKPDGTVVGQVVTEESLWEVSQKVSNKQTYLCINCTNTGMQGYFFESLY